MIHESSILHQILTYALSGPGTKRKEMMPTIRATAEPTATGRNIILGERCVKN